MQHLLNQVNAALQEQTEGIEGQVEALTGDILLDADPPRVRRVLRSFVVRIQANRQGGTIHYTFPLADPMGLYAKRPWRESNPRRST